MRFGVPLIRGRLLRRYRRFFADVELDAGGEVTAHCPNPGAMLGLAEAGAGVWVWRNDDPKRTLRYSWELVAADGCLVGINANRPNRLAEEAILAGKVPELAGHAGLRREVRYGENSRVDLVLGHGTDHVCYVEVKNVHLMRRSGLAEFPDSVTARGARHLAELARVAAAGTRAVVLFVVQRHDCREFAVAADIDPAFAAAWRDATAAGVETLCYRCALSTEEIVLDKALPITG